MGDDVAVRVLHGRAVLWTVLFLPLGAWLWAQAVVLSDLRREDHRTEAVTPGRRRAAAPGPPLTPRPGGRGTRKHRRPAAVAAGRRGVEGQW